jgi:hypothetical protein
VIAGSVSPITSLNQTPVAWRPLLVGLLLAGALAWRLSRRERGFVAIAAATTGVQAGCHVLLTADGMRGSSPVALTAAAFWCHHGTTPLPVLPAGTHITGSELLTATPTASGPSAVVMAAMLAAHVVAAIASSVVLLRGERALCALARLLDRAAGRLPRLPRQATIDPVRLARVSAAGPAGWSPSRLRPLLCSAQRRGPPELLTISVITR